MTAATLPRPLTTPANDLVSPDEFSMHPLNVEEEVTRKKNKKKRREERKRKRSLSCSTESSSCSNGSKKKKKKHRHREEGPPSPRVNPIFLWVKEDNAKIVEVMCEDYDKRNRIRLTKTAAGWRAIPHTESWPRSKDLVNSEESQIGDLEKEVDPPDSCGDLSQGVESVDKTDQALEKLPVESPESLTESHPKPQIEELSDNPENQPDSQSPADSHCESHTESHSSHSERPHDSPVDSPTETDPHPQAESDPDLHIESNPETESHLESQIENHPEPPAENPKESDKGVFTLDENHNNETEETKRFDNYNLWDDLLGHELFDEFGDSARETTKFNQPELMDELEEMCHGIMTEREKEGDVYTFVASPHVEKKGKDPSKIEKVIEAVKAKAWSDRPMNLVMGEKPVPRSEFDNLDILWRLPEGTTIQHSNLTQGSAPPPAIEGNATISLVKPLSPSEPIQDEPLNLGIPKATSQSPPPLIEKPKSEFFLPSASPVQEEIKSLKLHHSTLEADYKSLKSQAQCLDYLMAEAKATEPLAQLKEIMSDPELTLPDPLLVPKARLSALIANPKKEIPLLMALTNEVKYPKLDADLMEVSLAHLQLLLQNGAKPDDIKLFQKHAEMLQSHLKIDNNCLDPAVSLNQMLWLPYLNQMDIRAPESSPDVVGMLNLMGYPYNWGPTYDYARQQHMMSMWQDMMKSSLPPPTRKYAYKPPQSHVFHPPPAPRRRERSAPRPDLRRRQVPKPPAPVPSLWPVQQPDFRLQNHAPAPYVQHHRHNVQHPPVDLPIPDPSPRLKVRKFDVDPNPVPKLINMEKKLPPAPMHLPPLPSPSTLYDTNPHLWHPLYTGSPSPEILSKLPHRYRPMSYYHQDPYMLQTGR